MWRISSRSLSMPTSRPSASITGSAPMPERTRSRAASRSSVSGARGARRLGHDLAHARAAARARPRAARASRAPLRPIVRREDAIDHAGAREHAREGAERLEVAAGHARRREEHDDESRRLFARVAIVDVARDGLGRHTNRDAELLRGLRAVVRDERAAALHHEILAASLRDSRAQRLGLADHARGGETLDERPDRLRQAPLLERDHDAIRSQQLRQPHSRACAAARRSLSGGARCPCPPSRTPRASRPRCRQSRR